MKLDIRRAAWPMVLGSLVVVAGSIGTIHAVDANEFLAQQGWFGLTTLGFGFVVWGFLRGRRSN